MGMFANHADVYHPTEEWELGDCTACHNTGLLTYPVNVTVGEDWQEPCPYGCLVPEDRDGYYTDFEDEVELEDELLAAYYASKRPTEELDPFLILSRAARKIGLRSLSDMAHQLGKGTVSSDLDLMGLVEDDLHKTGDALLVYPCTVPAYLAGQPISYEDGILRVKYEYLGSELVVRYGALEQEFMRFAYSWDESYTTQEMLA